MINWDEHSIQNIDKSIQGKLTEIANLTVEFAKSEHPYKNQTGTNTRSITMDEIVENNKKVIRVYTQSGYGGYLEIGTSKMSAYSYIRPGFQKAIKTVKLEHTI